MSYQRNTHEGVFYPGADYDEEERAFLAAVERYKRQSRRPCPHWTEILALVKSLGYRVVAPRQPLPTYRSDAERHHDARRS